MEWSSVLLIALLVAGTVAGMGIVLRFAVIKPRIRTLLLDADGTLLDFDRVEASALKEAFETLGYPVSEEIEAAYHIHNLDCWKSLEKGEITRAQLKPLRFRKVFEQMGIDGDPEAIWPVYEKALGSYGYVFDGVEEACARLSKKYDLILVTNGTKSVQNARLLQSSIPEYLIAIYISEDVGYAKPAAEFFDKIFADHPKMKRSETMIVGDSLSGDIAGGNNAGIYTCWVNRTGEKRPDNLRIDLEIEDFVALEKEL